MVSLASNQLRAPRPERSFVWALALIVLLGAGIRVTYTLANKQDRQSCSLRDTNDPHKKLFPKNICGDAYVYHAGANLLADGKGFVNPPQYYYGAGANASADHPPLYMLYLASFSVLGLRTVLDHQLASVLLGLVTIVLTGLFGRDVFGRRVGLLAAFLAAVYPYIWVNDALVMSETIALTLTVATMWQSYRFWRSPTWKQAAGLGVLGGLLGLTRAELIIYVPLVAVIWALGRVRQRDWRLPLKRLSLIAGCLAVVIAPWLIRNLTAFKHPVTLSTGLGITLAYTNCDATYHGQFMGYWFYQCAYPLPNGVDQSDDEVLLRKRGLDYLTTHKRRLPVVVLARVGRQWNLYRAIQMTSLDELDTRERGLSRTGLAMFYGMIPFAVVGAVDLRKRRIRLTPLLLVPAIITLSAAATYGSTRFRVPAEMTLVILTACGVFALADNIKRRSPSGSHPDSDELVGGS
ncbi:MAG: hypothetical protein JWL70_2668 [Acidimicrobiia bacterium]|nr:hypothetical protein [Acidimicrobiia bacterium]